MNRPWPTRSSTLSPKIQKYHMLPMTCIQLPCRNRRAERLDHHGTALCGVGDYHLKGSPADPNRLYASQGTGWFGQLIQRSPDGGATWSRPAISLRTTAPLARTSGTHGTQRPWVFKRVWHLEPSLADPDTVYAGVEDAAIFRSSTRRSDVAGTGRPARPRQRGRNGSRARVECASTLSLSTQTIRTECTSRSRRPARSAPTTTERRGNRSLTG